MTFSMPKNSFVLIRTLKKFERTASNGCTDKPTIFPENKEYTGHFISQSDGVVIIRLDWRSWIYEFNNTEVEVWTKVDF